MSEPTRNPSSSLLDPAALMSIRNLELRARTVVEGFWHGLHRSPYHGFSVEFTEYRPYTPGDDPRYLDWKLAGRTDRYYIKKFEDETNLRCHLLVDLSRSMSFGSRGYSKADYARTLAATLGWFLTQQGDATGLLTFDGAMREYLPARHRRGHLRQLMLALEKPTEGRSTDLTAPLRRIVELVHKRGMIVLISDLLAPIDRLAGSLGLLTASGHEVIIFQVLDPAELNFDFQTAARFEDLETGRDVFLEPTLARANYVQRFSAHLEALRETCQGLGIMQVQAPSTHPLETVLFDFLKARADRGKVIRRRPAVA
jgi:uncharacterized protein (DUF58 family)